MPVSYIDFGYFALQTMLLIVIAISLIAGAALAAASRWRRNPAAAHCILFWALLWILITPLAAASNSWIRLSFLSLKAPVQTLVSHFETVVTPPNGLPIHAADAANTTSTRRGDHEEVKLEKTSTIDSVASLHVAITPAPTHRSPVNYEDTAHVDPASLRAARARAGAVAILALWLTGTVVLAGRIVYGCARLCAIRRNLTPITNQSFGDVLESVRQRLGARRLPEIASSDRVSTPCVIGLRRPTIVLPSKGIDGVTSKQLCDVLIHECAHVWRRDTVVAMLQRIAAVLFWPNPLVHLVNRCLTNAREEVCDNYVLVGSSAVSYGETLLRFALLVRDDGLMTSVGVFRWRGRLERRIAGLLDEGRCTDVRAAGATRFVGPVIFGIFCLLACSSTVSLGQPSQLANTPHDHLRRSNGPGDDSSKVSARKAPLSKSDVQSVELVRGEPHTLFVPENVRVELGIRKEDSDHLAVARKPAPIQPLVFFGTTSIDPTSIVTIRSPATSPSGAMVLDIGKVATNVGPSGRNVNPREIRVGDRVTKGQLLAVLYSSTVANAKSDLANAISQLKIDDEMLKQVQAKHADVSESSLVNIERDVREKKSAADRATRTLLGWGISQKEIQATLEEAQRIKGTGQPLSALADSHWGRLEIRSPVDGNLLEKNVVQHGVVDKQTDLFRIANRDRLLVFAQLPEDKIAAMAALGPNSPWTVTVEHGPTAPGYITDVDWAVDPNQHTVRVKGDVGNRLGLLRGGETVRVSVSIPAVAADVVEVPAECVVDDGAQSFVFVQRDANKANFTMQPVDVVSRLRRTVLLRTKPSSTREGEHHEVALPSKQPVLPGTRLLQSGLHQLKTILKAREVEAGH